VVPGLHSNLILGLPWLAAVGGVLDAEKGELKIRKAHGMIVRDENHQARKRRDSIIVEEEDSHLDPNFGKKVLSGKILATSLWEITTILSATLQTLSDAD